MLLILIKIIGLYLLIGFITAITILIIYLWDLRENKNQPDNGSMFGFAFLVVGFPIIIFLWPWFIIDQLR